MRVVLILCSITLAVCLLACGSGQPIAQPTEPERTEKERQADTAAEADRVDEITFDYLCQRYANREDADRQYLNKLIVVRGFMSKINKAPNRLRGETEPYAFLSQSMPLGPPPHLQAIVYFERDEAIRIRDYQQGREYELHCRCDGIHQGFIVLRDCFIPQLDHAEHWTKSGKNHYK